jgi:hypothetical protein
LRRADSSSLSLDDDAVLLSLLMPLSRCGRVAAAVDREDCSFGLRRLSASDSYGISLDCCWYFGDGGLD